MVIISELSPRYKIIDWEIGSFQVGNVGTHDGTDQYVSSTASDNNSGISMCLSITPFICWASNYAELQLLKKNIILQLRSYSEDSDKDWN